MVPIVIDYINPSKYGIWLTISSIVGWFSFFNIGLTQGLRNKFAEALANGEHKKAQIYVSTTYAILGMIFFAVWLLFMIVNNFLDWSELLKVDAGLREEVTILVVIVFTYFCITFVLKIITTLLTADQKPAIASFVDVLGQLFSLIVVFILIHTTAGSLVSLGLALCLAPLAVLIFANFVFFRKRYKQYRPSVSKIRMTYAKDLFNLGLKFFVIQIAALIQYQTANIIIARSFSTTAVTEYNIVYKYFGLLLMFNTIFLNPFWSASTEAYALNDIKWIKNGMKKYNLLNVLILAASLLMLLSSDFIYRIWLGEGVVSIDFKLSLWGCIYFNTMIFGAKYVNFLNGINALKIQFISSIISPFIYIAIALLFINVWQLGVFSLFITSIISNFNGLVLAPIQYHKIINVGKKGIWTKE